MKIFLEQAHSLICIALQNRHRALITIAGEQLWAEERAKELLQQLNKNALWVSDNPRDQANSVDFNASRRWLGRELDTLVFDAHTGFDPNIFALLCGTVRAGGALILLTPPLEHWANHPDPVNKRCSVWGMQVHFSRYLARLAQLLPGHSQLLLQQKKKLLQNKTRAIEAPAADNEQTRLLKAITSSYSVEDALLAVISGDRGRGKSAALGLLAAKLAQLGATRIIITAPRKAALEVLMQHAQDHWPAAATALSECVIFMPPDQLCLTLQPCDALLLDEMGSIHLGLLKRLLDSYPRLVMAGTVHGYEGAGRGFHTRLRKHIQQNYPHCQWLQLTQPIRWSVDDPLEKACNSLLMLDAEYQVSTARPYQFAFLDRDQLLSDEHLLSQVYGLLAAAHYRTRPLDLRQMLDGPNIKIAVLRIDAAVVAASLIAAEGPLNDNGLNAQIVAAKRRPAGHLLPQILMQRLKLISAAELRYWRIVRIAVQPELQNNGVGSDFLEHIEERARAEQIDCLGSVFAVDLAVLKFWQRAHFRSTHLGDNCEATSGSYALTLLKALNSRANSLTVLARATWRKQQIETFSHSHPALPHELCSALELDFKCDEKAITGTIGT